MNELIAWTSAASPEDYLQLFLSWPLHVQIVAGCLTFFTLTFLLAFVVPAFIRRWKLGGVIKRLRKAEAAAVGNETFKSDSTLRHLWDEFQETLHSQKELNAETGDYEIKALRATVPAEIFFSNEALVNTPLRTEFFKHLPGILTGIGIIGTFTGLITGLSRFEVSADPDIVRDGLNSLLTGVYEAFVVSAIAIFLAILFTAIERLFVTSLYKRVEKICHLLDSKFQAGAGEEYLSRLVESSESSAKEARQLKQSLVNDLKQILDEVTQRQIAASNHTANEMARQVVSGMSQQLSGPIEAMNQALSQVTGNQGDAVNRLLTDTMSAMTAQMKDLFGNQLQGIGEMQQQTIHTMTSAAAKLEELVEKIGAATEQNTDAMSRKLTETLDAMQARQAAIDDQFRTLTEKLRAQADESQQRNSAAIQQAIGALNEQVQKTVNDLQAMTEGAATRDAQRGEAFQKETSAAVASITEEAKSFVQESSRSVAAMEAAIAAIQRITTDSIGKMSAGADKLYQASQKYAESANSTSMTLERTHALVSSLSTASDGLKQSADALFNTLSDFRNTRETLASMLESLGTMVENAKREVAMSTDVVARLEGAAGALGSAEREAQEYLDRVTQVLEQSHRDFGTQVVSTLNSVNSEFHRHLTQATKTLSGAIQDLEGVFDQIPSRA